MSSLLENLPDDVNSYDAILGTPSTQKVLRILVCWDQLPVKEIISKSGLSESQVYTTLRNLAKIQVIEQVSRGFFRLSPHPFAVSIKQAYLIVLKRIVGQKLYKLSKDMEKYPPKDFAGELVFLTEQWKPLLEKHFSAKMSSLAGHLIDL